MNVDDYIQGGVNPEIQFPEIDLAKSHAPGCPPGEMPFIMQPLDFKKVIVFTASHWNPFPPRARFNQFLPKIADDCVGRGPRVALCRLFGYTEKLQGALIQNFKPDYWPKGHVMHHAELVEILRHTPHNLRCGADPATARSWFVGWKAVLAEGLDERPMQYLVAESPDANEGAWVTPDAQKGDGQRVFAGGDVDFYKRYLREREARLAAECGTKLGAMPDPILRAGDAKGFAANMGDGSTKFLELFLRDDQAKDPLLGPMYWRPAKVRATVFDDVHDAGKLVDLFACNWEKPMDATNHPHLLISDACQNTINCLLNWDGKKATLEGRPVNSPYADGVDMLRVLFDLEIPFQDTTSTPTYEGGAW